MWRGSKANSEYNKHPKHRGLAAKQNTEDIKYEHFFIETGLKNANFQHIYAFDKTTNGQTDI